MKVRVFLLSLLLSISFVSFNDINVCYASSSYEVDKQVNDVINLIAALPNVCTLEDEKAVKNARLAYDNLLPSQKVNVTNLLTLLEKENQIATLYSEISYVVGLIESLPSIEEVELNDEIEINKVLEKYNMLDNLQKELVSNYSKILLLINKINAIYTSIEEVKSLIDGLPNIDNVDSTIYIKLNEIEKIYNTLSVDQKEKITNINKYLEIKELINKINIIINAIDNIPDKLTKEHLLVLENINNEYKSLTSKQRTLVINYEKFIVLYNSVLEALEFNELIEEFINYVDYNNKYLLDYLLNKYMSFNDNQKVFITNYDKLVYLIEEINKEEEYYNEAKVVIDLINKLPVEVTLLDKGLIQNARNEYDALYDDSKKYVDNYHILLQKEAIILNLEKEQEMENIENLYQKINDIINDINNVKEEVDNDKKESEKLVEDVKKFIVETKENEAKGFNKYIIIAIGLTSVFIIIAIVYVFSLQQNKIKIDKEIY